MHFKQFYLGCLAHASYLVGDDGLCAIVDPQRDVEQYLAEAEARGLRIAHVIETHLHADFVSGHVELARRAGATIHIGHRAGATFDHVPVHDGDELVLGDVVLRFLETPGHTPESVCVLITDRAVSPAPCKLLTGDTLFIGDVGRPDLVGSKGYTAEDMAGLMYDSLRGKLLPLDDAVEVFPAHGAGSACGRNISSALSCTLGTQRATNHALQPMSREDFVRLMTTGLTPAPPYFPHSAELNRRGAPALDELPPPPALAPAAVAAALADGAIALDVRPAAAFGAGHLPGAVNIGLGGMFAAWAGTLVAIGTPLVLLAGHPGQVAEARTRLARVGHHEVVGFLEGGVEAWRAADRALETVPQMEVGELARRLAAPGAPFVLDVRRPGEWRAGHIEGALHAPVDTLHAHLDGLHRETELAVVCAAGYRSSAATSLLRRHGFSRLINVTGGMTAWSQAGLPTVSEVPATA